MKNPRVNGERREASPGMRRKLRANGHIEALIEELRRLGITEHRIVVGSKHPLLEFQLNGKTHTMAFAGSPRARSRSVAAAVQNLRRIVRAAS